MRHQQLARISFVGLLLTVAAGAQSALPGIDLTQIAGLSRDDGGDLTAIGANYRATFASGGITFVPALGEAAPGRQPWSCRLLSITRDGRSALQVQNSPFDVAEMVDERHARYSRGNITERYDVRPDGVELSYVFDERPAGTGDLVVAAAVTSAATGEPTADGGYRFVDPRWGGVELGAVTGIAADGARCRGSMHLADGVLQLRLPADFVSNATYPIVLDPLIGTAFAIATPSIADTNIVTAYQHSSGNYLAVWQRPYGVSAHEIIGQRVTADGTLTGAPIAIASNAFEDPTNPTVCACVPAGRFVVAWQHTVAMTTNYSIKGRTVPATAGLMNAIGTWSVGSNRTDPTLCAGAGSGSLDVMLAWRAPGVGAEIRRVTVATTGGVSFGAVATAISTSNTIQSGPQITATRNGAGVGIVGLETASGTNHTLRLRAFGTSAPLGSQVNAVAAFAGTLRHTIGCNGSDFLLTYMQNDLRQAQVVWNGATLQVAASQPLVTGITALDLDIAWLGDRYVCVWEQSNGGLGTPVRGVPVKQNGTICGPVFDLTPAVGNSHRAPSIGSVKQGGGTDDTALLAWHLVAPAMFSLSVKAQRFEAMVGQPPVQLSPGCPGGGTLTANGPFALGNETFTFDLAGGDPTAPFAVLGLSDGSTTPVTCGCTFTQSLVTQLALPQAGAASLPFVVAGTPSTLGFQLEAQWFLVGGTVSPCSLVPGFTGSNRLLLTVAQ